MVTINGEKVAAVGKTVLAYLSENGYVVGTIAVEINEEILPKSEYDNTVFQEGDVVEIVNFVGGG